MVSHLSMIVARSKNNAIGLNNELLWHIPEDLKHFKDKTSNKIVVMGRKTYESIGRPLPKRKNVVVTRNSNYKTENSVIVDNFESIKAMLDNSVDDKVYIVNNIKHVYMMILCSHTEICIIGGATLYEEFMDMADTLYVTEVDIVTEGDTFFPKINSRFQLTDSEKGKSEGSEYDYTFCTYNRK